MHFVQRLFHGKDSNAKVRLWKFVIHRQISLNFRIDPASGIGHREPNLMKQVDPRILNPLISLLPKHL